MKADASVRPAPAVAPRPALYRSYSRRSDVERLLRRGGKAAGTPLVLLHDAMSGSRMLEARMRALGVNRPVIAPDIAGNADSDGLAANADIAAYAADTLATLRDAGVTRFDLYGEGLGAVLALAIAQGAPDQVGKLVLDRPILPTDDERADLLAHFAPPMEARWDGTHFLTAWHILRDAGMFWPWYRRSRAGIRWSEPEIDPVLLQPRLIEWLKGKATYASFARAAIAADTTALLRVTNQALVLVGTDLTAAHGERAAAALPHSELLVAAADTGMIERFLTKDLITAL
jgi:pimeloyl-ACP methyl ester carboxylesterase